MKKTVLLFIFLGILVHIFASELDSLKAELTNADPEERIELLIIISEVLLEDEPDESLQYSKIALNEEGKDSARYLDILENIGYAFTSLTKADSAMIYYSTALELATRMESPEQIAEIIYNMAYVANDQQDFQLALEYYNEAFDSFLELDNPKKNANITNNIGLIYEQLNLYDKALDYLLKAHQIYKDLGDMDGLGSNYLNLGNIYFTLGNKEKALDYYSRSYEIYLELEDNEGIPSALNNIGLIHHENEELETAMDYYQRSLELTDINMDKANAAYTMINIGMILIENKKIDESWKYIDDAYKLSLDADNNVAIAYTAMAMGEYFLEKSQPDSAFIYLTQALDIGKEFELRDIILSSYDGMMENCEMQNDFEEALLFSQKYIALNDTVFGDVSKKVAVVQSSYEQIEKKREIEQLKTEKKMQLKIRNYLSFTIIIALALAVLFFFLFTQKKREVKIRKEMEKHKEETISLRSIIYNISQIADETNDLQSVYCAIQANLRKVIDTSNFFISIYNSETDSFSFPFPNDSKNDYKDDIQEYPAGKSLSAMLVHTRESFLGNSTDLELLEEKGIVIRRGALSKAWLGVPLIAGGTVIGIMAVQSYEDENAFTKKDLEMMKFFGAQISNILMRIITDKNLKNSEERFRTLAENSDVAIFTIDAKGCFQFVNPTVERISGYSKQELIGKSVVDMLPKEYKNIIMDRIKQRMSGINFESSHYQITNKRGEIRWMDLTSSLIKLHDEEFILCSALDITESKIADDKVVKSLKEKEILLKEIHHRVKNNMQIISSLLKLQAQYVDDEKIREVFQISQDRVHSMSLVHEKLYSSPDLANIHIGSYFQSLVSHLLISYLDDMKQITVDYDLENIDIDINFAIPCGLILNELTTNCLKYAFPNERQGIIKVKFRLIDNVYHFSVSDNGIGMPKDFSLENANSLGLQLVSSLTIQLHGKLVEQHEQGSSFTVIFPKSRDKKLT